jgi:hypothetical protein
VVIDLGHAWTAIGTATALTTGPGCVATVEGTTPVATSTVLSNTTTPATLTVYFASPVTSVTVAASCG